MKQNIAIIGCGWLGRPLAHHLLSLGFAVAGSTRSAEKAKQLKSEGIDATVLLLSETTLEGDTDRLLINATQVIINIPPGLRGNPNKDHVAEIDQLVKRINASNVAHVIYCSSTSVFQNDESFRVITEESLPNSNDNSGRQLIQIEKNLKENSNFITTIIRPSGLIGADRHPGKILAGKSEISDPESPINLIHRDDVIGVISELLDEKHWGQTINLAMPQHPSKKDYYSNYAKTHGLEAPNFDLDTPSKGKIIDSGQSLDHLTYRLKHSL
ncbi:NAD(P)H-binding protein [Winogradskyella maritima]|uniref:NAD(P)H-binding protein n=1 Tax=Winogradskyella maritima TaxID=1517766 RepID=A0ABV8ADS6_9FLAO|nr:NAD(P)H-binding protein [Winogradskyella maritima]